MTSPRTSNSRIKTIQSAERLAVRLYSEAVRLEAEAKTAQNSPEEKAWWVVRQAAAEAVDTLRQLRGAPGTKPAPKYIWPPKKPQGPLDFQDVPEKE